MMDLLYKGTNTTIVVIAIANTCLSEPSFPTTVTLTSPVSIKYIPSAGSPCWMITAPRLYVLDVNASARFMRSYGYGGNEKMLINVVEKWKKELLGQYVKMNMWQKKLTFKELSRGTFSKSASYILRFWNAFRKTILLNVCLSIAQSIPSPADCMVAALGMLYINANSPKLPLFSQQPTLTSWFPCFIKMLYVPLEKY